MAFEIDVDAIVDAATSKETFDVLAFAADTTNLPVHDIVVYTDADAAVKLARIYLTEAQRAADDDGLSIADESAVDEDEVNALHARLVASALTFHLCGIAPAAVKAINAKLKATKPYKEGAENTEFNEAFNNTLVAKTIVSVTNVAGAVDERKWTHEQVGKLIAALYDSEAGKLYDATAQLTYVGDIFDRAVSADFS